MENVTTLWGFMGLLVIQGLAFLKNLNDSKTARLVASAEADKAKQEIADQRAATAQKRDQDHALLAQRVDQIEKTQHDLSQVMGKMSDKVDAISEGVAFIKGRLTPATRKANYVLLDDK